LYVSGYVKTAPGSTPQFQVYINSVDGVSGGGWNLDIYSAAAVFNRRVHMANQFGEGDGSTAGHYFSIYLGISYLTDINVVVASSGAGTGEIYVAATYALKVN